MDLIPLSDRPPADRPSGFSRMDVTKFYDRHKKGWYAQRRSRLLLDGLPKAMRSTILRRNYLEVIDSNEDGAIEVIEDEHNAYIYFDDDKNTLLYNNIVDIPNSDVNLPRRRILSFSSSLSIKPENGLPQFLCTGLRPSGPLHRIIPMKPQINSETRPNVSAAGGYRATFEMSIQTLSLREIKIYHDKNRKRNDELNFKNISPCVLLSSEMDFLDLKGADGVYPVEVEVSGYVVICETKQIAIDIINPGDDPSKISLDFITTDTIDNWKHVLGAESTTSSVPIPLQVLLNIFENEVSSWNKLFEVLEYHMHWLNAHVHEGNCKMLLVKMLLCTVTLLDKLKRLRQHHSDFLEQIVSSAGSESTIEGRSSLNRPSSTGPPATVDEPPAEEVALRKCKEYFQEKEKPIDQLLKDARATIGTALNVHSINESSRSIEQNNSLKRLSWITFIFLPLLFIAALFGMNIDILGNDPHWWWYLVLTIPAVVIIFGTWWIIRRAEKRALSDVESAFKLK